MFTTYRSRLSLFLATCVFVSGISLVLWPSLAQASAFENVTVGTADGPVGRTNIQTLADFEDGILHNAQNPTAEGYYFSEDAHFDVSLVDGGPDGSQKALRMHQKTGPYEDNGEWKYLQMWWVGPRTGLDAYVKESRRANSMSFAVKGFDAIVGSPRQNFVLGGYAKQKTPQYLQLNEPESHNMHNYYQTVIDWGGPSGTWREVLYRANPITQRNEQHSGGYELFLDHAELWPDQTRFYFQFDTGTPDVGPGDVYLDNIRFFYENPFLAAFPHVGVRRARAGQTVTHRVVVWNTHPNMERNFHIRLAGWRQTGRGGGAEWAANDAVIVDSAGQSIDRTGPLLPGQGFVFHVTFTVPTQDRNGQNQVEGNEGTLLLSVYQDPEEVPNQHSHQQPPSIKNVTENRYDLPGVGIVLKTLVAANPSPTGLPAAVSEIQAAANGDSWVDLEWASPAKSGNTQQLSTDPAAMAYAIRYSTRPITDEESWQAAVPVESIPPMFGPGLTQRYTIRGLGVAQQYYAAVRAYNEDGVASAIQSVSFTTTQATEVSAPITPPPGPQDLLVRP